MAYTNPTIQEFKDYFDRDFPFGTTINEVRDSDIQKAMNQTIAFMNEALFCTQASYTIGFLLLTAHFLVTNLRASSQGISGQYTWLQNSKSVGSVSEGLSIPDRILENPELSMLSKTSYGAEFLFMILPYLTGQMFTVCSVTNP